MKHRLEAEMDLESLAARWRLDPRDPLGDSVPSHEPMGQAIKPAQRRAPTAQQKRERRAIQRGQVKTAEYAAADFGKTVADEFDRLQGQHGSPAKSWNIADQSDRGDGSGDAGGTPVSSTMTSGGGGGTGAGSGSTASRRATAEIYTPKADDPGYEWSTGEHAGTAHCEGCGNEHTAEYDHQETTWNGSRHQETGRPIFAVTCPEDGLTDFVNPHGLSTRATRAETNIANSMGQILLQRGQMIRTPTGQALTVKDVRRHETSRDHYYLDTDAGTSLVPWSTSFEMVTQNDQQQNLPGTGIQGGNFGDQRQNTGNVERGSAEGNSMPDNCPSCGSKGTLNRRGGKFQCSRCGHTQNPQGGGLNFSDSTQQYVSMIDPNRRQGAIARRVAAVLAEPNQEESL